jgi:L-lactate dehydrogenase complex protein LldE
MNVGLFIPCYIDQFYPGVGIASLQLLEKAGCTVEFLPDQTCCGQPLANSGFENESKSTASLFVKNFADFDFIVMPSGSCALHVKHHYDFLDQTAAVKKVRQSVYELGEFLSEKTDLSFEQVSFPFRTGIHASCHGLRGLRLASASEQVIPKFDKIRNLLSQVKDIQLMDITRSDECCGFGGTFAVKEPEVSTVMGLDRIEDHRTAGVEVITGADMSCLMHMEGLLRRTHDKIRVVHFAEILNGFVQ